MLILLKILAVLYCAIADLARGSNIELIQGTGKIGDLALYGLLVWFILDLPLYIGILFVLGWVVGWSFGWGDIIGPVLDDKPLPKETRHKWQIGVLRKSKFLALCVRGGMLAAPLLVLGYWNQKVLVMGIATWVVFVISAYLTPRLFETFRWSSMEMLRGFLNGLCAFVITLSM